MTASQVFTQFKAHFQGPVLPRLLMGGVLLWTSSCASVNRWSADARESAPSLALGERSSEVTHAFATQQENESQVVHPLVHETQAREPIAQPAPTRDPLSGGVPDRALSEAVAPTLTAIEDEDSEGVSNSSPRHAGSIQQISNETIAMGPHGADPFCPATVYPGEPRVQLSCPPGFPCPPMIPAMPQGLSSFPQESAEDEYLCDGGDRRLPVRYDSFQRLGLDTEDTVVEFPDEAGNLQVRATNRVCVYAPRFGSVRSMTATNEDFTITRAAGTHEKSTVAGYDHRMTIDERVQRDALHRLDMRSRASGVGQLQLDRMIASDVRAGHHEVLLNVFEDYAAFKEGRFDHIDAAVLALAADTAFEWSQQQAPTIQGHYRGGQVIEGKVYAQEYVGVEDRSTPGDLQIAKIVDKSVARSGDVLAFTIRFDNVGDREILEVRVIDNLSPRLEYVAGSVQSNLQGKLDVQPNGEGSQVLTFDFKDPLAGKSGGWLSFQCKVR